MNVDWDHQAKTLGPRIYAYFCRRGFVSQASDLTQDTLVRLFELVENGHFDPSRSSLQAYGFGVARLVCLENSRAQKIPDSFIEDEVGMESELSLKQMRKRVREAVDELPEAQKEVVSLLLDGELKLEEIGISLQMPTGTVKSHIARAKDKLREKLFSLWENL